MKEVIFKKQPMKYFLRLSKNEQQRLQKVFDSLAREDYQNLDIKLLHGEWSGMKRVRVGDLRVIFQTLDELTLEIFSIAPRGDVYK